MDLSRGKKAVRASLLGKAFEQKKRITPVQDAKFWCETGLDKDGFRKAYIDKYIGYGIFSTTDFKHGQFLLEYVGSLITSEEAEQKSLLYTRKNKSSPPRCYMYHFSFRGEKLCIDATKNVQRLAKYINDAPLKDPKCNAKMKLMVFEGRPRLCLFALRDIKCGEEIRYDYGEDERFLFWRYKAKVAELDGQEEPSDGTDFDDDPFDVDCDRNVESNEIQSSDGYGHDVSDIQDPDYELEESDSSSTKAHTSDDEDQKSGKCKTSTGLDVLWMQENENDKTVLGKIGPNLLLNSSFYYLKNTLSDEVIDSYMYLLVEGRNVLYIDTITATNIFDGNLDKTNLLKNDVVEDYDACIAVVNENGGHWVLLIILWKEQEIIYINPLGETESSIKEYCHHWYHFLDRRFKEELYVGGIRPWKLSTVNHQKQLDSVSCGVFVLKFAEHYLTNEPLMLTYSVEQTRKEIGRKLLEAVEAHGMDCCENQADDIPKSTEKIEQRDAETTIACEHRTVASLKSLERTGRRGAQMLDDKDNQTDTSQRLNAKTEQCGGFRCDICQKIFKKKGALTTHVKSHWKKTGTYKKPSRPCPFCESLQTRLSRHIIHKHAELPAVINILSLPEKERQAGFDQLRKDGIELYNKKQAAKEVPAFLAERRVGEEGMLVRCSKCRGYYKRNLFYRHKEICVGDGAEVPRKLEISCRVMQTKIEDEFQKEVLSRFHRDSVGNLCRTDDTLFIIGKRLFQVNKKKVDKDMEVRKSVMSDMRLLARVYEEFQKYFSDSLSLEDLYLRENFQYLERAIENVTTDSEGKLKHGVKNTLYFLLRTTVDYLIGHHTIQKNDDRVKDLEMFVKTLEFHKDLVFGDAAYAIELRRLEKLRVPENRLDEEDVETLRLHTLKVIENLTCSYTFFDLHDFVLLRDALCSRITLYNARRGGEPSRLKMKHFFEAKNKRWVDNEGVEKLQNWEKELFKDILITYQPGKGTHLVPVLIPGDCVAGLEILCSLDTRKRAHVLDENNYLFPNTGFSSDHVSGWNTTNKLAKEAGVKRLDLINATKQRHRISTIYCALDVPEDERQYFYKHMGHTKEVNWGTYQYPLPIMEITRVGKHLQDIDKGSSKKGSMPNNGFNGETIHDPQASKEEQNPQDSATCPITPEQNQSANNVVNGEQSCTVIRSRKKDTGNSDRDYFRWTEEETRSVRKAFKHWIEMPEGNNLPSTGYLRDYVETNSCRFTVTKLRTKIMNEQNKCQRLAKKRIRNMYEKQ